jgi:hypothetical protein
MRELPSSSREARNHRKKCDPQGFPIHLAESRLQLFAIATSAGPASIIPQITTSIWPKRRWNVGERDRMPFYLVGFSESSTKFAKILAVD